MFSGNAILCAGLIIGGALGFLLGYVTAWDEANVLFEQRYRRWREHFNRVTGKHFYNV